MRRQPRPPVTAAEAAQALAMRLAGATYQQIADQLGYAHYSNARRLIQQTIGDDRALRTAVRFNGGLHGRHWPTQDGYMLAWAPGHPLARRDGRVLAHRLVLYEHLGPGPHPCAKCGLVLDWSELDVDHINRDGTDNRLENLQPCCRSCNTFLGWRRWRHRARRLIHGWDWERVA